MAKIHAAKPAEAHRADEHGTIAYTPMGANPGKNPNLCNRGPSRRGIGISFTLAATQRERVTCAGCLKALAAN